jgi:predicted transcriptional regulator
VYSDGYDLANHEGVIPVGSTCRTCDRSDCEERAVPSLRQPLAIDENVRGVSIYARSGPPSPAAIARNVRGSFTNKGPT